MALKTEEAALSLSQKIKAQEELVILQLLNLKFKAKDIEITLLYEDLYMDLLANAQDHMK
jgi:hypothetical protein